MFIPLTDKERKLISRIASLDWALLRKLSGKQYAVVFFSDSLTSWRDFEKNWGLQRQNVTESNGYTSTVILDFDSMFLWS